MREKKFRAWELYKEGGGKMRSWEDLQSYFIYELFHKDVIELQFTGLCDKNGVEIYDGDIVSYNYNGDFGHGKIHYSESILAWTLSPIKSLPNKLFVADDLFWCDVVLEVLGNIYENPGLLEADD